ncbi:N-6 DNA methylase [Candidatus Bathyarchaeota archaeon]|nr:N-6 DNA methylase [Candidatus Bathyarchaeota archaeon]
MPGIGQVEKPTEDTYLSELVSVIKQIGEGMGFDAECNWKTPSGKPDLLLYLNGNLIAVIEVKRPEIPLSDRELNQQALRYADWYRQRHGIRFYGIHNMKYLKLMKYVKEQAPKTLLDYFGKAEGSGWVPASDFPFQIIPWAESIEDYKQISINREARRNLEAFLLKFKEIIEGKSVDLSADVISTIRECIELGAKAGSAKLFSYYKRNEGIHRLFEEWLKERGYRRPDDDNELRRLLELMIKEQLYTFSMKILFYLVLQSIDAEMASSLKEKLDSINFTDPNLFKKAFDMLFQYAVDKTHDFEEVFQTNTVDRLPLMDQTLPQLKKLISYLTQVRWSEINVDVIGRIFEGLIHEERRHLLGQHYTDTKIVDLIVSATVKEPGKLIDPASGSGTFLVRAINYWRVRYGERPEIYELVEGIDIDKLASMLSKINLYIQALKGMGETLASGQVYYPKVRRGDFFKLDLPFDYRYVVANPPYTRQEEMTLAFYDRNYKKVLEESVKDIKGWDKRASIYAYFLMRGCKILKENGRLGFIVENSWLNAEYGGSIRKWLLKNFSIEYVIESLVEKWFEDAEVITNIIVGERKNPGSEHVVRFIYFKKPLEELIGSPPPLEDYAANQRYYERIERILRDADACEVISKGYGLLENATSKVISIRNNLLEQIEERLGKWGLFRGPKRYIDLLLSYLVEGFEGLCLLGDILKIDRGLTTNANELFYLPSKFWRYVAEDEQALFLKHQTMGTIRISKKNLRPLIRLSHLSDATYQVDRLPRLKKEDYVLWIKDVNMVDDPGTLKYIEWMKSHLEEQYKLSHGGKYPTLVAKLRSSNWMALPDKSGGLFLLRSAIHKNFSVFLNKVKSAQVDKRLYIGYVNERYSNLDERLMFACLNSIVTYLGMELIGRTNLGEGALDIGVVDYTKIPIVDPRWLQERLTEMNKFGEFLSIVDIFMKRKPKDIEMELSDNLRIKVDEFILSSLNFSRNDLKELYDQFLKLIHFRTQRAGQRINL